MDTEKVRVITKSGKSAKQTQERRVIFKLFALPFYKTILTRKLTVKTVSSVMGKVRINLSKQKPEDCMKAVDKCGSTCLFNGVTHFWSKEINQMTEPTATGGRSFKHQDGSVNHEINLIVAQNEAMNGTIVNDESINRGNEDNESQAAGSPHTFCTNNPWTCGIEKTQKRNYLAVHSASAERIDRKHMAAKFIISKVKEMKAQLVSSVGIERADTLDSP